MTTPQTIVWTHVDDEAPCLDNKMLFCSKKRTLYFGQVYLQINMSNGRLTYYLRELDILVTHWAIIAPPEVKE